MQTTAKEFFVQGAGDIELTPLIPNAATSAELPPSATDVTDATVSAEGATWASSIAKFFASCLTLWASMFPQSSDQQEVPAADELEVPAAAGGRTYAYWIKFAMAIIAFFIFLFLTFRSSFVWPGKPAFELQGCALYNLTVTQSPALVQSTFVVTMGVHNSNRVISFKLEHVIAFITFHDEPVSNRTPLPDHSFEAGQSYNWTWMKKSSDLALPPRTGIEFNNYMLNGSLPVAVLMEADMRWHMWSMSKGSKKLLAHCDTFLSRTNDYFSSKSPSALCKSNWSWT